MDSKSIFTYCRNKTFFPGYTQTRLYRSWTGMRSRCNDPNCPDYRNYGGRGITVCDEWNEYFITFAEWAIDNGYRDGLTIDRIDNDKGYYPGNCRWVDRLAQNNNRRDNRKLTLNGVTHNLSQWARITGLKENCIRERLRRGWSEEDALTKPVKKGRNL